MNGLLFTFNNAKRHPMFTNRGRPLEQAKEFSIHTLSGDDKDFMMRSDSVTRKIHQQLKCLLQFQTDPCM